MLCVQLVDLRADHEGDLATDILTSPHRMVRRDAGKQRRRIVRQQFKTLCDPNAPTLPLVSFGGAALISLFIGLGILMSVQANRKLVST